MGRLLALVAVMSAAVVLVGTALATHNWGNYHWARTSNPFTLKLGDNVSSTWDSHLAIASSDWSQSSVLNTTVVAGQAKGKNCRPTAGRVEVCSGRYGNTGWLGIAQIWVSGGSHITQGSVRVNDTYHDSPPYNTSEWRLFVMCQEVGHEFGLDHQDENFNNANLGTCMDYTNSPSSNQHPNQHDYDQLEAIYAHLDSTTTVASAPAALPGNAPPFSQASRANGSHYVDDLGNGQRLVTFVLWTPFGE
ncbi:MAG: hypothetical protein A2Y55_13450 [Actinobacteria bacterium RBG_16_68_12]|nr:MAG: hypothetical protein A2Y55_13450 [Actinobacteria bacterium RBG_16_68_12]